MHVGDKYGVGHRLRDAWKTDKIRESNAFKNIASNRRTLY